MINAPEIVWTVRSGIPADGGAGLRCRNIYAALWGGSYMARLHRYVPSADKSGYYLRGRSPESNTTFQTGRAATLLVDWLDIDLGDRIPDDLLWKMYDSGLVWTKSGGRTAPTDPDLVDFLENASGRKPLTDAQSRKLRQFIADYEGTDADAVNQLSSLVSGVEYTRPTKQVTTFTDQNDLSRIADKYFRSERVNSAVETVLDRYGIEANRSQVTEYPVAVLETIPELAEGFFELTDLDISGETVAYTFRDPEMWIREGMVWTDWRLFDGRSRPRTTPDFEAEFEMDTDAHHVGSPVVGYATIADNDVSYLELTPDFEREGATPITGSALDDQPYAAFRDYVHDCLVRQFDSITAYDLDGPTTAFSR